MTNDELAVNATRLRRRMLKLIAHAGAGHTGGGLSAMDILNALYNRVLRVSPESFDDPNRDRYVQSKGHCVEALYTVLAQRGYFPDADLDTVCRYQSHYIGHPTRKVRGVEMNTGALGHGLAISVGMAVAAKLDARAFRVFTLLGDGELAEGSNWEAAMAASHYRLDNLVAIIDHNGLQISGRTCEVLSNEPLTDKWIAFGWEVRSIDGHDYAQLLESLCAAPASGRPLLVVANTVKGSGVSFMENVSKWHHGVPSQTELEQACRELETLEARLLEKSS